VRAPAFDGVLAKPGIADRCNYCRMPLFAFEGREPVVSPTAWIAPTATLVGDVRVEDEASVWYGAVLRADFGPIIVRRGANIQDGSVLHGGHDPVTEIGEGVTVGHLCVVHGAVIGTEALIGNGATVLDGAVIGRHALVAAGAVVPPGMAVPDGMLAVGTPARVAREVSGSAKEWVDTNPEIYRQLARRHSAGISPVHGDLQSGRPGLRATAANASASVAPPRAGDHAARP
jgi:carbonic anhydrase/acetyltransferase-like protein (isoleucine patch superfamily)